MLEVKIENLTHAIEALSREIQQNHAGISLRVSNIEEEIWGFPKGKGLGLLQKIRDNNRKWTIVWAVCVALFAALGRVASSLYDKAVTDWVYNSPSQRWEREQRRPKVKNYKIYMKSDQVPASQKVEAPPVDKP